MRSSGNIKAVLTLLLAVLLSSLTAQNLLRNCDLEQLTGCPTTHGQIGKCKYWSSPGNGTTDYLHACNNGNFSVPDNQFGHQEARSGDAYANLISYYPQSGQYREYLQAKLACRLQEGKTYIVSFWVSCADDSHYGIDAIGAHLTVDKLVQPDNDVIILNEDVHITNPLGHPLDNKDEWVEIHGTYVAQGDEQYITIGNFLYNGNLTITSFTSWDGSYASYFVDDVSVESIEPILDLGPDTTICANDSITIDISAICDNATLTWEDGSTDKVRTISEPGTYSLQGLIGCTDFYDAITISNSPDPGHFLPPDTVICPDKLVDIIPEGTYHAYYWQDGSDQPVYTTDIAGQFWLEVTDVYGCVYSDSINIDGLTEPVFSLGADTLFCLGQELTLDPGIDSAYHHFLWSDYSKGTQLTVSDSGEYWLHVSNPCGEMTDTILISTYNCNAAIAAPNAFTPNADGLNDVFILKTENISNFRMYIYNRWGTLIYESSGLEEGWNGDYKGSPAPVGTYAWLAIYDIGMGDVERETKKISGTVVLLR